MQMEMDENMDHKMVPVAKTMVEIILKKIVDFQKSRNFFCIKNLEKQMFLVDFK